MWQRQSALVFPVVRPSSPGARRLSLRRPVSTTRCEWCLGRDRHRLVRLWWLRILGASSSVAAAGRANVMLSPQPTQPTHHEASDALRGLHFSCAMCPLRAVVRVNSAPQRGQYDLAAVPDFSRWCRSRLLNVENWRPLHPCSQHCGFGRELSTRTPRSGAPPSAAAAAAAEDGSCPGPPG